MRTQFTKLIAMSAGLALLGGCGGAQSGNPLPVTQAAATTVSANAPGLGNVAPDVSKTVCPAGMTCQGVTILAPLVATISKTGQVTLVQTASPVAAIVAAPTTLVFPTSRFIANVSCGNAAGCTIAAAGTVEYGNSFVFAAPVVPGVKLVGQVLDFAGGKATVPAGSYYFYLARYGS